ncbi:MAG TPA: phenylacetate--CoA ligase family protein, partial [Thermoprotei archaeon]|nr:phenylacetate--CoA ligase family protein [Thermoprotei archaeon]
MYWNEQIECMPINELVKLQEKKLIESKVIERAYRSALYKDRWKNLNIDPKEIKSREDLKKFPYTTGRDLKEVFEKRPVKEIICSKNVYLWFSTSGTTGKPKWIPYSNEEIKIFEETMLRNICVYRELLPEGGKMINITTPAPFVGSGLFYFGLFAQLLNRINIEIIPISLTNLKNCLSFAITREPNYIASYPSLLLRIAELIKYYA